MHKPSDFWFTFAPLFVINTYVFVTLTLFAFISKKRPKTAEIESRHSSVILNKWIREYWMWLTAPIYSFFIRFNVTPNAISFLGTVMACLCAVAFAFSHMGLAGWLMVFGASFDFFDGQIARATNRVTKAGSFFDSSLDRLSEAATLTGLAYLYRNSFIFWIVMGIYVGSMLTSYTKAKGETMGIDYAGGMMQRPERIAYLGAGAILTPMLTYFVHPLLARVFTQLTYADCESYLYCIPLTFVCVFCNAAAFNRIVNIMKLLSKNDNKARN
ncbi:MAG: CDP-alcohol phosphatidyltransferase family protein [Deltaproteobacteria bacterium]|nr:CDP-alcohol phosphatidyltransferase family protein [Deltaproteobacteria bacterium]